jgi:HK97 gp10 family phage protein
MPFETGGIAAEMARFDHLAKGADTACQNAVKAGGKVLAEALSKAAPVRTGGLAGSIKAGSVSYNAGDGYTCEVAPKGNHPKTGEPFAKIGNILEYGRTNMPARAWFNPTVAGAAPEVIAAMKAEIDKQQGGA